MQRSAAALVFASTYVIATACSTPFAAIGDMKFWHDHSFVFGGDP